MSVYEHVPADHTVPHESIELMQVLVALTTCVKRLLLDLFGAYGPSSLSRTAKYGPIAKAATVRAKPGTLEILLSPSGVRSDIITHLVPKAPPKTVFNFVSRTEGVDLDFLKAKSAEESLQRDRIAHLLELLSRELRGEMQRQLRLLHLDSSTRAARARKEALARAALKTGSGQHLRAGAYHVGDDDELPRELAAAAQERSEAADAIMRLLEDYHLVSLSDSMSYLKTTIEATLPRLARIAGRGGDGGPGPHSAAAAAAGTGTGAAAAGRLHGAHPVPAAAVAVAAMGSPVAGGRPIRGGTAAGARGGLLAARPAGSPSAGVGASGGGAGQLPAVSGRGGSGDGKGDGDPPRGAGHSELGTSVSGGGRFPIDRAAVVLHEDWTAQQAAAASAAAHRRQPLFAEAPLSAAALAGRPPTGTVRDARPRGGVGHDTGHVGSEYDAGSAGGGDWHAGRDGDGYEHSDGHGRGRGNSHGDGHGEGEGYGNGGGYGNGASSRPREGVRCSGDYHSSAGFEGDVDYGDSVGSDRGPLGHAADGRGYAGGGAEGSDERGHASTHAPGRQHHGVGAPPVQPAAADPLARMRAAERAMAAAGELDDASASSDDRGSFGVAGPGPGAAAGMAAAGSQTNVCLRKPSASGRLPALSPMR